MKPSDGRMNPGTGYKVPQMARERKSPKNGNNIFTEELIAVSVRLNRYTYEREGVMGRGSKYGVSHKGKDRGLKEACGLESVWKVFEKCFRGEQ